MRSVAALVGVTLAAIGATFVLIGYGLQTRSVPAAGQYNYMYFPMYYLAMLTQYGGGIVVAIGAALTAYGTASRDGSIVN